MKSIKRAALAAFVSTCLAPVPFTVPAQARETQTVTASALFSERVPYMSIELTSDRSVRGLMSRVYAAADRVCSRAASPGGSMIGEVDAQSSCFHPAVQAARLQVLRAVEQHHAGVSIAAASLLVSAR